MKKTLKTLLVILIIMSIWITISNAASFTVKLTSNKLQVEPGKEVVITFAVGNFTSTETGVAGFEGTLQYDDTIFEAVTADSFALKNNWKKFEYNAGNGKFTDYNSEYITVDQEVFALTLKVKAGAKTGKSTVYFKGIIAGTGEEKVIIGDKSIDITVGSGAIVIGNNTITPTANPTPNPTPTPTITPTPTKTPTPTPVPTNISKTNSLPKTGISDYMLPVIITVIAVSTIIMFIKYKKVNK